MWKNITAQAVPLTIAQLVQIMYNIVDRIYIGHLPDVGSLALTGIGVTFPITTLIVACASLFGTGGTPLFSIERGAQNDEKARAIMGNVFTMILIASVLLAVFCFAFRTRILYLFGASGKTIFYAESYLSIYLFGIIFSMIVTGMNGFISALGFPRIAMWTTIIGAVLNLILDPIFIFVFSMGVKGAATATVISQIVSAVWVLRFLTVGEPTIQLKFRYMRLKRRIVAKVLGLGVTGFMQQGTNCLVQIVCNVTLLGVGGDLYVGIMTVINSVREIASLPVYGISNGGKPVLGYNYGAHKPERIKEGVRFMAATGIIYTACMWIIIELFPKFFIGIFTDDVHTIELGTRAMRLYFMGFVFMSLQFVGQAVFVGLGKAKRAVFFSLFRKAIIVVPLAILLPRFMGLGTDGVFLAEPISDLLGGAACFITMYITLYRKL